MAPGEALEKDVTADVSFVLMPYTSVERPSIALGTLTACLRESGISTTTVYANLLFADQIGITAYEGINTSGVHHNIGEWTFAAEAFPDADLHAEEYLSSLVETLGCPPTAKAELLAIRRVARRFIDDVAHRVLEGQPRIVGCSSMFQQNCPSLALLRRIRQLNPNVITMLGGANCEGAMGRVLHRSFEWVDYVVSGEADKLLPELCTSIFEYISRSCPMGSSHPYRDPRTILQCQGAASPGPRFSTWTSCLSPISMTISRN